MQTKSTIASYSLLSFISMFTLEFCHAQDAGLQSVTNKAVSGQATPLPNAFVSSQSHEASVVTIDPNQLLLHAIHQAVWGPAMTYKVHQQVHAYDQDVVVSGEYKTAGGGSGQFRYTARISSGETTVDTIQVSDGRLMYTQMGSKEPPKRVIIDQIRNDLGNAIHQAANQPEMSIYLAIGGQPELLRNLYHRYRWYKAMAKQVNGIDVWQLVGKLRTERPKIAGNTELDAMSMSPLPADSSVPTEVILTLGRSASLPYFPYQIDYLRRIHSKDGEPASLKLVSRLSHSDPVPTNVSEKDFFFKVLDSVDRIDNDTATYRPLSKIAGQVALPIN
ncbi:MAG: hypothetical protein ABL921_08715 [Pirellula sp.]